MLVMSPCPSASQFGSAVVLVEPKWRAKVELRIRIVRQPAIGTLLVPLLFSTYG